MLKKAKNTKKNSNAATKEKQMRKSNKFMIAVGAAIVSTGVIAGCGAKETAQSTVVEGKRGKCCFRFKRRNKVS